MFSSSREQATRIKAQQSQSKLMQMVIAKQKELEEKRRKKEQELKRREEEKEEERRKQEGKESTRRFGFVRGSMSQSNQNQYQTQFSNTNFDRYSEEEKREEEERKKEQRRQQAEEKKKAYEEEKLRLQLEDERRKRQKEKEATLLKKQALEEKKRQLLEEMERRKASEEEAEKAQKKEAAYKEKLDRWRSKYQKLSLPTGQKFIDKSTETKILDSKTKKTEATKSDETENMESVGTSSWPEKVAENELENRVGSSVESLLEVKQKKKIGNPFTQEVCESLRVPCR